MSEARSFDAAAVAQTLLRHCQEQQWSGYDPYDALNSAWLRTFPVLDAKLPRLVLIQLLKRSPVNLRPLLRVPPTQNAKAIGLFLKAVLNLSRAGVPVNGAIASDLIDRLVALRSPGTAYWSWGYSFPWQTRSHLVPAHAPNLVSTVFVADALLDAHVATGDRRCLEMAVSAADYLLSDLYWEDEDVASFSYPSKAFRSPVHNANLLGAALFGRVARLAAADRFVRPALKAARYAVARQNPDGSWLYGEQTTQAWIDNFHTGYNLGALASIGRELETDEFGPAIERGVHFYREHFFDEQGVAQYFHDKTYPIDIHCVAQSIVTLIEVGHDTAMARKVLGWALANMWDERGYFYYRVLRTGTIRTSYMRWSQAWMLFALSVFQQAERVRAIVPAPEPAMVTHQ